MKNFLSFFISLFVFQSTFSQVRLEPSVNINGLDYYLYDDINEAMVADGNSWEGYLELPSKVTYEGKEYTVTKIDWKAFCSCHTMTGISIPETIRKIDFLLPQQGQPFDGCDHLESITVKDGNQWFSSEEGVLYDKEKTKLICYPAASKRKIFTVPYGVKSIGEGAFGYCQNLTAVSFPNTINDMDRCAFHNCEVLKQIELPDGISIIRQNTFQCCSNLKTVILPKSLVIIEELAFHRCFSLENISFPDNLQEIGGLAFSDCNSLRVIILPESIHKVKGNPFYNCSLDAIVIRGENANSIYKGWLHYLNDSVTIYVPSAEIEQYKNGFSGTVLPLELYTSVDAINVSFAQENALFDLSGRRLEKKPTKGIYIQGRKKVLIQR